MFSTCLPLQVTEVDEEKARLMVSNKRIAADERVGGYKVGVCSHVWHVWVAGGLRSCEIEQRAADERAGAATRWVFCPPQRTCLTLLGW